MFVLNGSKIWSTYAWKSDYALCVCRTDWDVPKHRGLSVLIVKVHQPGIRIDQIKHVDGTEEFCQEFFDDVPIPADQVLGRVNDGWTVVVAAAAPRARGDGRRLALRDRAAQPRNDEAAAGPASGRWPPCLGRRATPGSGSWSEKPGY